MPSHLRLQSSFEPVAAKATYQTSPTLPPAKKQKMSLTQTYYVASTARSKLGREASRADHNLRLLVGHANLLDGLMQDLQDAEREQERWFHESVASASKPQPKHIQWVDTIAEEEEVEDSDDESDDGSDIYDEDAEMFDIPLRKVRSPPVTISSVEMEDDEDEDADYDDEENDEEHALARVASKHSPPELTHDSDSDSEDESMPVSPDQPTMEFSEKERQAITTTNFYDAKSQQRLEDYMMQQAQQPQAPIIAAC